eukprot:c14_g1_i1.p1 GENE.c14_g1_i1~~c14_g1_i1.p1  ORF type:complete len:552 (+),score=113.40 c14_g1_i1:36-1658(+)
MASTLVEQSRALFEDMERLELAMALDMKRKPKSHVGGVSQQHRVKDRLTKISELAEKQQKLFKDEDGSRKADIASMSSGNVFSKFYDSLRELREYHKKYPVDQRTVQLEDNVDTIVNFAPPEFSSEESFGRYLDLHEHYYRWINISRRPEPIDYFNFVKKFDRFHEIPISLKTALYTEYIEKLWEYLEGFFKRSQPLISLAPQLKKLEEELDSRWTKGLLPGWQPKGDTATTSSDTGANGDHGASSSDNTAPAPTTDVDTNGQSANNVVDLDAALTPEDLEQYGMETLKVELQRRGIKCGGDLSERAKRLFSIKGLNDTEIPKKMRTGKRADSLSQEEMLANKRYKKLAFAEAKIGLLVDILRDVVDATAQRVQKNQARTYQEIEAQLDEELQLSSDDDDNKSDKSVDSDTDAKPKHNPLHVPEGHDGQPIPYWLFKLHGLGIEYKCEICGNYSYWGRRAFERHFQEWRHAHAMRVLKIPNTKHFHEITKIEDAFTLYNKLKMDMTLKAWRPEDYEEFEDNVGNVMNKKTFDDLRRQGLL